MIKEFNTASRLMTPLGCRGTQERRRQGLWRICAETGIGSKIYKFIHQKAVFFMPSLCAYASVCRWQRVNVSKEGGGGERERDEREKDIASLIVSAFCELYNIKQPATNTATKKLQLCHNVSSTF